MDIISVFETEGVGSIPAGPANKENIMKPMAMKVIHSGERFICDDLRNVDIIEGVEYLFVHRPNEQRIFKMRKDVLVKDNTAVVKGKSRDPAKV